MFDVELTINWNNESFQKLLFFILFQVKLILNLVKVNNGVFQARALFE